MNQFLVAGVRDQVQEFRIFSEEVLPDIGAVFGDVGLQLAVHHFAHALLQQAGGIAFQSASQSPPQITLMTFQPAPRKAASNSWMTLPLPRTRPSRRCKLQLMTKMRLSSFSREASVSEPMDSGSSISPSPRNAQSGGASRDDAAIFQVAHEARLVDRVDRSEAHRNGREPPEIGHQPRVRIAGKAGRVAQLVAEVLEVLFVSGLQERAAIDAGRGVALEINQVAGLIAVLGMEKVIESHFQQCRERRVGRSTAAHWCRGIA